MTSNLLTNLNYDINLIFASSVDVYGSSPQLPLNEKSPLNPESWYAESKVQCEQLIADSIAPEASGYVVFRLPGIYGNLRAGGAVVDQMVRQILGQPSSFELRDSHVLRDWVYVRDFWKLLWSLTNQSTYNRNCYNLAMGVSWPIEMWYRKVWTCLNGLSGDITVKTASATKDAYDLTFDTTALREDFPVFHFTPRIRTFLEYRS
jgi:nucleoside-diphosphate-sugar epimerase